MAIMLYWISLLNSLECDLNMERLNLYKKHIIFLNILHSYNYKNLFLGYATQFYYTIQTQ